MSNSSTSSSPTLSMSIKNTTPSPTGYSNKLSDGGLYSGIENELEITFTLTTATAQTLSQSKSKSKNKLQIDQSISSASSISYQWKGENGDSTWKDSKTSGTIDDYSQFPISVPSQTLSKGDTITLCIKLNVVKIPETLPNSTPSGALLASIYYNERNPFGDHETSSFSCNSSTLTIQPAQSTQHLAEPVISITPTYNQDSKLDISLPAFISNALYTSIFNEDGTPSVPIANSLQLAINISGHTAPSTPLLIYFDYGVGLNQLCNNEAKGKGFSVKDWATPVIKGSSDWTISNTPNQYGQWTLTYTKTTGWTGTDSVTIEFNQIASCNIANDPVGSNVYVSFAGDNKVYYPTLVSQSIKLWNSKEYATFIQFDSNGTSTPSISIDSNYMGTLPISYQVFGASKAYVSWSVTNGYNNSIDETRPLPLDIDLNNPSSWKLVYGSSQPFSLTTYFDPTTDVQFTFKSLLEKGGVTVSDKSIDVGPFYSASGTLPPPKIVSYRILNFHSADSGELFVTLEWFVTGLATDDYCKIDGYDMQLPGSHGTSPYICTLLFNFSTNLTLYIYSTTGNTFLGISALPNNPPKLHNVVPISAAATTDGTLYTTIRQTPLVIQKSIDGQTWTTIDNPSSYSYNEGDIFPRIISDNNGNLNIVFGGGTKIYSAKYDSETTQSWNDTTISSFPDSPPRGDLSEPVQLLANTLYAKSPTDLQVNYYSYSSTYIDPPYLRGRPDGNGSFDNSTTLFFFSGQKITESYLITDITESDSKKHIPAALDWFCMGDSYMYKVGKDGKNYVSIKVLQNISSNKTAIFISYPIPSYRNSISIVGEPKLIYDNIQKYLYLLYIDSQTKLLYWWKSKPSITTQTDSSGNTTIDVDFAASAWSFVSAIPIVQEGFTAIYNNGRMIVLQSDGTNIYNYEFNLQNNQNTQPIYMCATTNGLYAISNVYSTFEGKKQHDVLTRRYMDIITSTDYLTWSKPTAFLLGHIEISYPQNYERFGSITTDGQYLYVNCPGADYAISRKTIGGDSFEEVQEFGTALYRLCYSKVLKQFKSNSGGVYWIIEDGYNRYISYFNVFRSGDFQVEKTDAPYGHTIFQGNFYFITIYSPFGPPYYVSLVSVSTSDIFIPNTNYKPNINFPFISADNVTSIELTVLNNKLLMFYSDKNHQLHYLISNNGHQWTHPMSMPIFASNFSLQETPRGTVISWQSKEYTNHNFIYLPVSSIQNVIILPTSQFGHFNSMSMCVLGDVTFLAYPSTANTIRILSSADSKTWSTASEITFGSPNADYPGTFTVGPSIATDENKLYIGVGYSCSEGYYSLVIPSKGNSGTSWDFPTFSTEVDSGSQQLIYSNNKVAGFQYSYYPLQLSYDKEKAGFYATTQWSDTSMYIYPSYNLGEKGMYVDIINDINSGITSSKFNSKYYLSYRNTKGLLTIISGDEILSSTFGNVQTLPYYLGGTPQITTLGVYLVIVFTDFYNTLQYIYSSDGISWTSPNSLYAQAINFAVSKDTLENNIIISYLNDYDVNTNNIEVNVISIPLLTLSGLPSSNAMQLNGMSICILDKKYYLAYPSCANSITILSSADLNTWTTASKITFGHPDADYPGTFTVGPSITTDDKLLYIGIGYEGCSLIIPSTNSSGTSWDFPTFSTEVETGSQQLVWTANQVAGFEGTTYPIALNYHSEVSGKAGFYATTQWSDSSMYIYPSYNLGEKGMYVEDFKDVNSGVTSSKFNSKYYLSYRNTNGLLTITSGGKILSYTFGDIQVLPYYLSSTPQIISVGKYLVIVFSDFNNTLQYIYSTDGTTWSSPVSLNIQTTTFAVSLDAEETNVKTNVKTNVNIVYLTGYDATKGRITTGLATISL